MDKKTEELRDIFMETTDSETVTEAQSESAGSLADDAAAVGDRLRTLIGRMREQRRTCRWTTGLNSLVCPLRLPANTARWRLPSGDRHGPTADSAMSLPNC